MSLVKRAKMLVIQELAKRNSPCRAPEIVAAILKSNLNGDISKNVIQQAISHLKKSGDIDYIVDGQQFGSHKISLSPRVAAEQPVQEQSSEQFEEYGDGVIFRIVVIESNVVMSYEKTLADAEKKAVEYVKARSKPVRIERVTITPIAEYHQSIEVKAKPL